MKITKSEWFILFVNIIFLIIFFIIFLGRKNYEFMIYVGAIIFVLILISLLRIKFKFSKSVLAGLTLVGFLHMLGGAWIINGLRLYGHYFVFGLIKYDLIIHFLGVFFGVLLFYEILKPYIKIEKTNWLILFLTLLFVGIGIGGVHEIIEFIITLAVPETGVGGYVNTMWDMVANAIGGLCAFVWIVLRRIKI
tara:strand:- start:481 stop:1059 length:579 start_codon:yes stop_codon:yes gene_type:complete